MKTYFIIVRYNMDDLKGDDPLGPHLFADSYLVKLIKGLDDVVYLGVETAIGEEGWPREHLFKAEGLDTTLKVLGIFSEQDDDFTRSFMEQDDDDDEGALTMEYKEIFDDPITDDEREYSRVSIEHDPRDTLKMLEGDEPLDFEVMVSGFDEDDDDEDEPAECPVCGGPGVILGTLGTRVHYRCRDCGMEFSHTDDDDEPN